MLNPNIRIEPVYVDLATAAFMTTLAESTIQAMVTRDEFPAPRELSGRRVGYLYPRSWSGHRSGHARQCFRPRTREQRKAKPSRCREIPSSRA